MPATAGPSGRVQLKDVLMHMRTNPNDQETLDVLQEISQVAEEGRTALTGSASSRRRKETHLKEWLELYRLIQLDIEDVSSDNEVEGMLFALPYEDIAKWLISNLAQDPEVE
jgi:hypothetical protein